MRPHQPVGHLLPDLLGGQALVVAVVPFGQKGRHLVDFQAGQFGGDQRAPPRARDHQRVVEPEHRLARRRPAWPALAPSRSGRVRSGRCAGRTSTTRSRRDEAETADAAEGPRRQILPHAPSMCGYPCNDEHRDAGTCGRQSKGWGCQDDDGRVVGRGDGGEGQTGAARRPGSTGMFDVFAGPGSRQAGRVDPRSAAR